MDLNDQDMMLLANAHQSLSSYLEALNVQSNQIWGALEVVSVVVSVVVIVILPSSFVGSGCQRILSSRRAKGTGETSTDRDGILKQKRRPSFLWYTRRM
jgi:hypothetical protein